MALRRDRQPVYYPTIDGWAIYSTREQRLYVTTTTESHRRQKATHAQTTAPGR